jgi:biofilm PGA synthesis N-glycosyltransferase PgaC
VTVVLAVRNEAEHVVRRLENLMSQDFPAERLHVLVLCNGSADGTEAVARGFAASADRVQVLESPASEGKSGAINRGVEAADSDVVVFADARQLFAQDAVSALVAPLADPDVGAVTGRLVIGRADCPAVEGVRWYWGMETWLRAAESRSGSVVGATGAIYAIRRSVFRPIPPNTILDDVYVPLQIGIAGHRIVMAEDAVAFDVASGTQGTEYRRKRRTMVGNIQLLTSLSGLLSPFENPLWFRFISHKLLRVLMPVCLLGMLALSAFLSAALYQWLFAAELAVYVLGVVGLVFPLRPLSFPAAFLLVHCAILAAVFRWNQNASHVWSPSESVATTLPPRLDC